MDMEEKAVLLAAAEGLAQGALSVPAAAAAASENGTTAATGEGLAASAPAGAEEAGAQKTGAAAGTNAYGEFSWPDGYAADPETLARFVAVAGRIGLTKAAAQELALLHAELDLERGQRQAEFVAKNNDEWLREIHAHPDFGGSRLAATGENVAAVMRRFGSPLLTAQIRQMNVQNWPEMFYFLARVAGALAEDRSPASAGGGADGGGKSAAEILFPGMK